MSITVQDMENAQLDAITLAEVANSRVGGVAAGDPIIETVTREGDTINTVQGQLASLGFLIPAVDWMATISVTSNVQVYRFPIGTGEFYVAKVPVPFITGSVFTASNWQPLVSATSAQTVDNIAGLRAFTVTPPDNQLRNVLSHTSIGDKGDGPFIWNASSTATDNNGTVVKITTEPIGRWLRLFESDIYATWFNAIGDAIFTPSPINDTHGGTVTAGTDNTTALQAAINAAGRHGVVIINGAFKITGTLNLNNGCTIKGNGSRPDVVAVLGETNDGIYTATDITIVTLTDGNVSDLLLCGSGDINLVSHTVVGTGINMQQTQKTFPNIFVRNLLIGVKFVSGINIDFHNFRSRHCIDVMFAAADANVTNVSVFGGEAVTCDYGYRNPGSLTGTQDAISFNGFLFQKIVRAFKGEANNVLFNSCWFEDTSSSGVDQRSNNDNVPFEPLAGSFYWSGSANEFASSANASLNVAGSSISIEGYFNSAIEINALDYGSAGSVITRENNDIIALSGVTHRQVALQNHTLSPSIQTIDGDTTLAPSGSVYIDSAINTPQLVGINAGSVPSIEGSTVTVVNNTNVKIPVINLSGSASAANQILLDADFTILRWQAVAFIYETPGNTWRSLNVNREYFEGIATMTMIASTSGTITLNSSNNKIAFTKNGRVVNFQGWITVDSVSAPIGALTLEGLPFTSFNDGTGNHDRAAITLNFNTLAIAPTGDLAAYILNNSTVVNIFDGANGTGAITDTFANHVQANTVLVIQGNYFTT